MKYINKLLFYSHALHSKNVLLNIFYLTKNSSMFYAYALILENEAY